MPMGHIFGVQSVCPVPDWKSLEDRFLWKCLVWWIPCWVVQGCPGLEQQLFKENGRVLTCWVISAGVWLH